MMMMRYSLKDKHIADFESQVRELQTAALLEWQNKTEWSLFNWLQLNIPHSVQFYSFQKVVAVLGCKVTPCP